MAAQQGNALDVSTRLPGFYSETGDITLIGAVSVWALVLIVALPTSLRLAERLRRRGGCEIAADGLVWLALLWPLALIASPLIAPLLTLRALIWITSLTEPLWVPICTSIAACLASLRARRERKLPGYPGQIVPGRRWDADMPWNLPPEGRGSSGQL